MSSADSSERLMLRRNNWFFLIGALLVSPAQANDLESQLKMASGKAGFVAPDHSELQHIAQNFQDAFNGHENTIDWHTLAMESQAHPGFIIIQENASMRQGRGFFALRQLETKNWLLQAPHADTDLYTGKITSRLFLEGPFKAAQWNTVSRKTLIEGQDYPADMAHLPDTYWQAFTQAFAEKYSDGKIIQLHGYEQNSRKTRAGEASDMILSAGHTDPPQWVKQTADCLKNAFPGRVSLYPVDVKELGGTTNVQGKLLQQLGHNGFLHIEMSKKLRQQLLDQSETRSLLIKCL
ncbi:MAG: hypothetical protein HOP23_01120 [Methylococcaceae bacterium]|nr:hypothetical protein [Methylococcaceae bacterium]